MSKSAKLAVVAALVAAVAIVVALKQKPAKPAAGEKPEPQAAAGLPRLVDLGGSKCIPCKLMAPVLEELKTEYVGRLQVDVVDVNDDPATAEKLKVAIIPTQIFFDASGKELWRHEGFFSKADILAKWKELGVDLAPKAAGSSREEPGVKEGPR